MNGLGKHVRARVLEQESPCACLQRPVHVLVHIEGGDDDHGHRVRHVRSGQQPRGFDAIEFGHPDIEEADVGL